ncbi:uncharacterized protein [Nicotiana tomentosiformis]|uniref:uncharacterized protein n=1 Tax=Nicotiana tomentosiformis TaxID=4098 RepID=UPI00051AC4F6|nr:uncharacterized protein LOC104114174 [Nicotiana tomentosiformis]
MDAMMSNINGKFWLFFDIMIEWEVLLDTKQQVTIRVYHQDIGKHIMMTFVYAKCSSLKRLELWDKFYYLLSDMELPWVVGGDFNIIMHEDEKISVLLMYPPEYEDFAFCVISCGLFDLGYKGIPFTWWNGRPNSESIFKRLDRIFVNLPFQNLFPNIEVEHLIRTSSDHAPLLICCGEKAMLFVKPFKFLNFWIKHETFKDVKLKWVKVALSQWSKLTYGDIFTQLAIREDIVRVKEMLFEDEPNIQNRIMLQKAQAELKKYHSIEEQYWKQNAGIKWFAEGVRNTRFFHNHVNGKRQRLQLKRIQNGDGVWLESQDLMADDVVDFFQRQFT